jgi:hypothetical protein
MLAGFFRFYSELPLTFVGLDIESMRNEKQTPSTERNTAMQDHYIVWTHLTGRWTNATLEGYLDIDLNPQASGEGLSMPLVDALDFIANIETTIKSYRLVEVILEKV